jgi:hypothetical protein
MDPRKIERRPGGERWLDKAAGPVVRPYAMTRGRTVPQGVRLDLVTILVATGHPPSEHVRTSPEQRRLLILTGRPSTVADLASEMDLPLGVVRVLLGDLLQQGLVTIQRLLRQPQQPATAAEPATPAAAFPERPDRLLLTRVLNDLRAL